MNGASVRKLLRSIDGLLPESPTFRVVAGQRIAGKFYGATITTALQTLRDPVTGEALAYEALARSYSSTGAGLSPWGLFADASSDDHLIALDRLCRTVHALNFRVCGLSEGNGKLVLNVHERLLHAVVAEHGAFFRQVLDLIDVHPASVVIDVPPLKSVDVHWLKRVVESYRHAGFGVAIEASNNLQAKLLATLVRPDWVRMSSTEIGRDTVTELHSLGAKVVATRVENDVAHAHCLTVGVDLVQGFHYDQPSEVY